MKRLSILLISCLITAGAFAQTQPTSASGTYGNIFKLSASMFTRNTFQLGYERFFNPTTSLQINAGMNFRDSEYEQFWGVNSEAQLKFYVYNLIKPKNSHRLYFAPYIMNNYEVITRNDYGIYGNNTLDDSFDAVSAGIVFGWSFSFANRINLDISTGGGIRKAFNVDPSNNFTDIWDYSYSGIAPRLCVDVGFWF